MTFSKENDLVPVLLSTFLSYISMLLKQGDIFQVTTPLQVFLNRITYVRHSVGLTWMIVGQSLLGADLVLPGVCVCVSWPE